MKIIDDNKVNYSVFSTYRGALMGIAILGVMILHGIRWAEIEESLFAKIASPFARIAFTEGFIFLSGFGLYYSFSNNSNLEEFYKKRWYRLMVPFLIMATPFYLYSLLDNGDIMRFFLNESTLYFWIYGNNGMWYISISVLLYILFPFIYRLIFQGNDNKAITLRALLLTVLCIAAVVSISLISPEYYDMTSIGIEKLPMFIIGMLIGYYAIKSCKLTVYHLLGGGILVMATLFAKKADDFFIPYYEMSVRLLLMPFTCIVLNWFKPKRIIKILEWFGRYSLELYVLHMFFIGTIGSVLSICEYPGALIPMTKTMLTMTLAIIVCAPVHRAIDFVIKKLR